MGSLSDAFPKKFKEDHSEQKIKPGAVLHRHEKDTSPSKDKFSIIVGESNDKYSVARVLINSNVNPKVFNTLELQNLHIGVGKDELDCLTKNSYIDCSQLHEINKEDLIIEISQQPEIFKEDAPYELLQSITKTVSKAKTIKPVIKKRYGLL